MPRLRLSSGNPPIKGDSEETVKENPSQSPLMKRVK